MAQGDPDRGGFGIPTLIGAAFGDPIAGLLWGGFLRIAVIHHTTFFVNSLAHTLGKPLFNAEVSARDNWFVAMLTLGEGYHSFHHRFPDRLPQRHPLVSVGSGEVVDHHVQGRSDWPPTSAPRRCRRSSRRACRRR